MAMSCTCPAAVGREEVRSVPDAHVSVWACLFLCMCAYTNTYVSVCTHARVCDCVCVLAGLEGQLEVDRPFLGYKLYLPSPDGQGGDACAYFY